MQSSRSCGGRAKSLGPLVIHAMALAIRDRKGRVTEAYVGAAVADVHARNARGRPSLFGRRCPQVTVRLPPTCWNPERHRQAS